MREQGAHARGARGPDEHRWAAGPARLGRPERRVVSLELRADLRAALDRLPERQRLVVTLRDVEGLEIDEIGRLLDLTPGNTRVLLHRGRARLRAALPDALAAS